MGKIRVLERTFLRASITREFLKTEGFYFSHNIRFRSSDDKDKTTNLKSLEELNEEYRLIYGEGNFRFEKNATDKFSNHLPKSHFYRAVYVKNWLEI